MIPRRRFTIESGLTPDRAGALLMAAIGPPADRPFVGTMTGPSFRILRSSRGRNSFRPLVEGSIESARGGSRVVGTMRLHPVVTVFLGFVLLVPGWLVVTTIVASIGTGRWDRTALAVAGTMAGFVAIAAMSFVVESRRALADLAAIVRGEKAS